jgi:hypothetical protein
MGSDIFFLGIFLRLLQNQIPKPANTARRSAGTSPAATYLLLDACDGDDVLVGDDVDVGATVSIGDFVGNVAVAVDMLTGGLLAKVGAARVESSILQKKPFVPPPSTH